MTGVMGLMVFSVVVTSVALSACRRGAHIPNKLGADGPAAALVR